MYSEYQKKDQEYFSAWAPHFDSGLDGVFFRASYRAVLKERAPHSGAHVLDVACGTGGFIRTLLKTEPSLSITGIDYTPAMLAEAEIKFKNDPRVHLAQGSAEDIPLREQFDYVYCLDAFHHFQDADKAFEEMSRMTKPSGFIVILDPVFDGLIGVLMKFFLPFLGESHIMRRSTKEWHELLARHRFKIIEETRWLIFFKIFILQKKHMKIIIEQLPRGLSARTAIRRCGYGEHMSREVSYWKRLGTGSYPRFHVYSEERAGGAVCFNLHLDQKEVSYEGSHAHSGEYDGAVVEREAERIKRIIALQEDEDD